MATSNQLDDLLRRVRAARQNPGASLFPSRQVRDLTVIEFIGGLSLVIAVDSDGGIGPKPDDVVRTTGYVCGRFGGRVPLMEVLACGAHPIAAFDALAVEMVPLGEEIIRGVRDELLSVGLPPGFPLSGSTEDNVPTRQTGMGVVIVGIVESSAFRPGKSQRGNQVFCIGIPKSGPADDVTVDDPDIATALTVAEVSLVNEVHDILPVGSRGLLYESSQLAGSAGLSFEAVVPCPLDLHKSGGPSTCFIVAGPGSLAGELPLHTSAPVHCIGVLA